MQQFPGSENWNWARIRELAQKMAQTEGGKDLAVSAGRPWTSNAKDRMLAVYLLGFTGAAHPERLEVLRQRVPADPSWEVQEALAQAFDAYCAAIGYEAALPTIDAWLADAQPNARRAVSEGLRPWTSKRRAYFADHPAEAIRRLAALRPTPATMCAIRRATRCATFAAPTPRWWTPKRPPGTWMTRWSRSPISAC